MFEAGRQAGERPAPATQPFVERDEPGSTKEFRFDLPPRLSERHHRLLRGFIDTCGMPAELGFDRPNERSDRSAEDRVLERADELAPPHRQRSESVELSGRGGGLARAGDEPHRPRRGTPEKIRVALEVVPDLGLGHDDRGRD